ncbi:MAG: Na+/H+ antiporter subunit E [Omnitrophica bacterium]|nr:Na+/H+ antiporter subunit E [Candidatus Omnitrophota bacterium]
MKRKTALFIIAFVTWVFLNWVPDTQHLIIGALASLLVVFITADLFTERQYTVKHHLRYWYFFTWYLPVFLWECFKANIDVAYRVLHPRLPIRPGIVKVKTKLKTDTALTFLANSITLTPGTLTVDINKDEGILYVHWIDVKAKDIESATKIVVERFERILTKIFE